jgi:hypothetical protein
MSERKVARFAMLEKATPGIQTAADEDTPWR